jgi:hypothetical protein
MRPFAGISASGDVGVTSIAKLADAEGPAAGQIAQPQIGARHCAML